MAGNRAFPSGSRYAGVSYWFAQVRPPTGGRFAGNPLSYPDCQPQERIMPSFDVVSQVDLQEVRNAVDQANREVTTRFDFKGTDASFEQNGDEIVLRASQEFQLQQMMDILRQKLVKRKVDIDCIEIRDPEVSLHQARQRVVIRQGIDADTGKRIVKLVKGSKIKVQTQIQGEQLRVTGKKRDDLQQVIALLRDADFAIPLQYVNFRD
jgi:uncharacterized protein YajQ (UPF0234 family)